MHNAMANAGQFHLWFGDFNVQQQPPYFFSDGLLCILAALCCLFRWTLRSSAAFMLFVQIFTSQFAAFRWTLDTFITSFFAAFYRWTLCSSPTFMLRFTDELYVHHQLLCCDSYELCVHHQPSCCFFLCTMCPSAAICCLFRWTLCSSAAFMLWFRYTLCSSVAFIAAIVITLLYHLLTINIVLFYMPCDGFEDIWIN